jgi:hypothetical protein
MLDAQMKSVMSVQVTLRKMATETEEQNEQGN